MKVTFFVALLLIASIAVAGQSEGSASALHRFEANWLQAILNQDNSWLDSLADEKLNITLADKTGLDERKKLVIDLTSALSPTESKVRISGTIAVLSNEPGRARSFQFLDTFNKKNGKWQIIATSLSEPSMVPNSVSSKPVETELNDLETTWAQGGVADPTTVESFIAPEFVATSRTGELRDRSAWLAARRSERIKSALTKDIQVHSISDSLAVVTGIEVTTANEVPGQQTSHQDRFTDTWVRRPQGLQIVARQVTRLS